MHSTDKTLVAAQMEAVGRGSADVEQQRLWMPESDEQVDPELQPGLARPSTAGDGDPKASGTWTNQQRAVLATRASWVVNWLLLVARAAAAPRPPRSSAPERGRAAPCRDMTNVSRKGQGGGFHCHRLQVRARKPGGQRGGPGLSVCALGQRVPNGSAQRLVPGGARPAGGTGGHRLCLHNVHRCIGSAAGQRRGAVAGLRKGRAAGAGRRVCRLWRTCCWHVPEAGPLFLLHAGGAAHRHDVGLGYVGLGRQTPRPLLRPRPTASA